MSVSWVEERGNAVFTNLWKGLLHWFGKVVETGVFSLKVWSVLSVVWRVCA